jgi:hypothetical protein
LEKLIVDLLYDNEIVIVPGFGAFITHSKDPQIVDGYIYPRKRVVAFNANLTSSDGFLYSQIAIKYQIPYDEAKVMVDKKVKEWNLDLEEKSKIHFFQIGTIYKNESQKIEFQPLEDINFEKESFGLEKIKLIELQRRRPEMYSFDRKRFHASKAGKNKKIVLYSMAAYIPVIVIFWFFILNGQNIPEQNQAGIQIFDTPKEVTEDVSMPESTEDRALEQDITENVNSDIQPEELKVQQAEDFKYHIIGGAFKDYDNAFSLLNELKADGFVPFIIQNGSLNLISYQGFNSNVEALDFLRKIKTERDNKAWLYKY